MENFGGGPLLLDGAMGTELTLRYFLPGQVEELLAANGFAILARYADYMGTTPDGDRPATVFVCTLA